MSEAVFFLFNLSEIYIIQICTEHDDYIRSVAIKETTCASASDDGSVRLWSLSDNTKSLATFAHGAGVSCCDWINENLVSCSSDKTIKIWNVERRGQYRMYNNRKVTNRFDSELDPYKK